MDCGKIIHIYLFVSRNKVFGNENVLQETIIIKVKRTFANPEDITITSFNSNFDFEEISTMNVPYDVVVTGKDYYLYLRTNEEKLGVLCKLKKCHGKLKCG